MKLIHQKAEEQWANASVSAPLSNNIKQLSDLVDLSTVDCRILEFSILLHNESLLENVGNFLGSLSSTRMFHALSVILNLPEQEIWKSLSSQNTLARSGLLSIDRNNSHCLRNKLGLLSYGFADQITSAETDPINLLRGTVVTAAPRQLDLSDYNHINSSLEILLPYLRHVTATQQHGANILLYGAPGTGKSQLTCVLADELGYELFEVASEDDGGDPIDGEQRLRVFRATQSFFAHRQVLIAFDEAEDVFDDGKSYFGHKSTAQLRKAWINRVLEGKPVPTLWLSNSVHGIDPAFIHADADLIYISAGLIRVRTGRLCLYGPPGTGKTAYGRWLAEQLAIPLLVKRASDLMSMWVGESEKNIAQAFQQAEQEGALLLIDEIDSFLQDRQNAHQGWEISLVNEMLTQMESFSGVFIASTNLMGNLDQSTLRRFDLKVKFDFLRSEQAWELLCRHCKQLDLSVPQPDLRSQIKRLHHLTPGDFAAVIRQHRFRPIESPAALISALEAECAVKEGKSTSAGFT
ncbi:ATPase family associated with various cellular activities (AAA) [Nitrosomonas eutropha]|uniref:ATPase family associated with various cellular activities (AAA) n=1 Tax=Nitrosomonas eutropha TaxID=916 RepID=A0A1I7F737_9PROT|nr:AAA family ATPase [Nitrosomonas eutropha]SFU31970.1 ATPase family associated with various cellular activities (AAA) [Nitrosomonas eutropha]